MKSIIDTNAKVKKNIKRYNRLEKIFTQKGLFVTQRHVFTTNNPITSVCLGSIDNYRNILNNN